MKFGLPISFIAHAGFAFGGLLIWDKHVAPLDQLQIIPLEIITVADDTNVRPAHIEPEVDEELSKPEPDLSSESEFIPKPGKEEVADTEPAAEIKPGETKPGSFDLDAFAELVKTERESNPQAQTQKVLSSEMEARRIRAIGDGDEMTISPEEYIRQKMGPCWYIDRGAKSFETLRVEVRLELNRQGDISNVRVLNEAGIIASGNAAWQAAQNNVVSALYECTPYKGLLQRDYSEWKVMKLNFQPSGGDI